MTKKSFFKTAQVEEILEKNISVSSVAIGLTKRLLEMHPDDALQLQMPIMPPSFLFKFRFDQRTASRHHYRHGAFLPFAQPKTKSDLTLENYTMASIIENTLSVLKTQKETEISYVGLSWKPLQGKDMRTRKCPFDAILEGVKIYSYVHNSTAQIDVDDRYIDTGGARTDGAIIHCKVPSRTKNKMRYPTNIEHLPIYNNDLQVSIALTTRTHYEKGLEPLRQTFRDLHYHGAKELTIADEFVFGPHDVAALLQTAYHFAKRDNLVPYHNLPFPLPSKKLAELYDKLCNNVIIFDTTLTGKRKLRNLHLDEKCVLLGRGIRALGNQAQYSEHGTKLRDYWSHLATPRFA